MSIHGLLSNPYTWVEMLNEFQVHPEIEVRIVVAVRQDTSVSSKIANHWRLGTNVPRQQDIKDARLGISAKLAAAYRSQSIGGDVMKTASAGLCFWLLLSSVAMTAQKPNVVLILLDDSGWTDFGCYGSRIQTPNIDQFVSQGMRFTDCHSAAPNCSPSRAGLLTGRTPSGVGVYSYLPANHVMHLRSEEVTLAELLKSAGYRTGHFGKWHLSRLRSDQPQPSDQGFDHSLGTDNNAIPSHRNPTNFVRNGQPVGEIEGYSCQIVVDETSDWLTSIEAEKKQTPFFACVWFHEPHTPIASPPSLVAKYQKLYPDLNKKQATYFANIENVDRAVGRLTAELDERGLADDTVVFLTSDNGPLNDFSSVGLRGKKSNVWEGGHRVPGAFRWPGRIEAGVECSVPVSGVDFLPTILDLAEIALPNDLEVDGTSLASLLLGDAKTLQREKPLYWFFYRLNPSLAIRDGRWALIADTNDSHRPKTHGLVRDDIPMIRSSRPVRFSLFDLESDLSQQVDLTARKPGLFQRLKSQLMEMHADVMATGHQWEIPAEYGKDSKRRIWDSY